MEHGFFHPSRGYWQTTGEPPADILATYPEGTQDVPLKPAADHEWIDGVWVHVPPVPVLPTQAQALRQIDADVDAIYTAAIGNRGPEYEAAEFEALSYQAAGFVGAVPPSVASWVAASGMTAQAAALDIIAQGSAWRQAAQAMRAQRLQAKAGVRSGAIAPTLAAWAGFVAQLRAQLGIDA